MLNISFSRERMKLVTPPGTFLSGADLAVVPRSQLPTLRDVRPEPFITRSLTNRDHRHRLREISRIPLDRDANRGSRLARATAEWVSSCSGSAFSSPLGLTLIVRVNGPSRDQRQCQPVQIAHQSTQFVDGHNRYEICSAHDVLYEERRYHFPDRSAAKWWVITNQFGRRNLTPYQRAELALVAEPLLRKKAKANQGTRTDMGRNLPQNSSESRDELAKLAHVSHDTIAKAKVIHDKATDDVKARLRAGETTINAEHKKIVQDAKKADQAARFTKKALPRGTYSVLLADPPWSYNNSGFDQSAAQQYPTLSTDNICTYELPNISESAVLFLWATSPLLPDALRVIERWGFTYKSSMVWVKDRAPGLGRFVNTKHELLLIATRGTAHPVAKVDSVFKASVGRHSQKPEASYEAIERMYPDWQKAEAFQRGETRKGWDGWGFEAQRACAMREPTFSGTGLLEGLDSGR